jgi:hypothetical protein
VKIHNDIPATTSDNFSLMKNIGTAIIPEMMYGSQYTVIQTRKIINNDISVVFFIIFGLEYGGGYGKNGWVGGGYCKYGSCCGYDSGGGYGGGYGGE